MKQKVVKNVKVHNRGAEDYKQVVMGDEVYIPAGGFVSVSRRQGINIKGHYCGKGVAVSLDIEPTYEEVDIGEQYVDHRTGQIFPSRESLLRHLGVDPDQADAVKKAPKFVCAICDEVFEDKGVLINHMEKCLAKLRKSTKKEVNE